MMNKIDSVTEAVKWAWGILSEDHEWLPRDSIVLFENQVWESQSCDIEARVVQWAMLWCSAPTSLDSGLVNDGVHREQRKEVVNVAICGSITCLFWRGNNPRTCFSDSQLSDYGALHDKMGSPTREGR